MNQAVAGAFETLCIHYGEDRRSDHGAVTPPIHQSSTFAYPDAESFSGRYAESPARYDYTRVANPTTDLLEKKIAMLERGESARAFGSGMAAISAAVLSCAGSGDHVICVETVYGPTRRLLDEYLPRLGIEATFVRGIDVADFGGAIRPNTKLIYVESPSSLFFELQDLAAVAQLARTRGIATICDNSNATPYFQNPLDAGIDLVVHTATKYIGGHSDLVAGVVIGSAERIARLSTREGELLGGISEPFTSWLMLRGLRTLAIRMERHQETAQAIARRLESEPRVARVYYPGLASHPQRTLAARQMRGHGGMLSFRLKDDGRRRAFALVDALQYFFIAVSWGGYESLAIPLEARDPESGEPCWIVRLSVGLENQVDLLRDLEHALNT
jgi:cystathionine beta-lyase